MALDITVHYTDPSTDPLHKQPFTIFPGETNSNSTSMVMVGQGSMNYGKYIMENLLHHMENFCSPALANPPWIANPNWAGDRNLGPQHATRGQLWYNTTDASLKVLQNVGVDGAGNKVFNWGTVGNVVVSTTAPENREALWYDISNASPNEWQLKIFNHHPSVNAWQSVAERYVKRAGDSISGNLVFTTNNIGIQATSGSFTGQIVPMTARGPAIIADQHATVVINRASATASGSEFVVGTGTTIPNAVDSNGRLLTVSDAGVVTIHKNTLSMNSRKIVMLGDGTANSDAANFGQLSAARTALQNQITALDTALTSLTTVVNGKVAKAGDTMSGALVINSTLYTGSLLTAGGGLTVSGGAATFGQNASVAGNFSVTGTTGLAGALTVNTTSTFGGAIQANSTLTVNGATVLRSTVAVTGLATLNNGLNVAGNATIGGTATVSGIMLMNQPITAIVNNRHLTTKEYVDGQIAAIPRPPVPRGLWAGVTTIANIRTTYADAVAYPNGTCIAFTYQWTYTYGTGNGTATATASQTRLAVRTEQQGWVESANLA